MRKIPFETVRAHYEAHRDKTRANWFGEAETSFFNTRYPEQAFRTGDGALAYFVTSDRPDDRAPWKWSVRCYNFSEAQVSTVGPFYYYQNEKAAERQARQAAREATITR